jgi:hypothetical protein
MPRARLDPREDREVRSPFEDRSRPPLVEVSPVMLLQMLFFLVIVF